MNFFFKLMFFCHIVARRISTFARGRKHRTIRLDDVLRLVVQDNEYQFPNSHTVWFFHINSKGDVFDVVPRDDGFTSEGMLFLLGFCFNIRKRQMAWRDDNAVVPVF